MKIALMFSGFARFYAKNYSSWHRIIEEYDCDVFMSIWDTESYKNHTRVISVDDHGQQSMDKLNVDHITSLYKPKSIQIDNYYDYHDIFLDKVKWQDEYRREAFLKQYPEKTWILNNLPVPNASMFYKRNSVSKLRKFFEEKNNVNYDVVVMSRTDFEPHSTHLSKYFKFVVENDQYIVSPPWPHRGRQSWVDYKKGINDFWFYGNPKFIDSMCSVYDNYKQLWEFCMKDEPKDYGYFEACNPHTLPVTQLLNVDKHEASIIKLTSQFGEIRRTHEDPRN